MVGVVQTAPYHGRAVPSVDTTHYDALCHVFDDSGFPLNRAPFDAYQRRPGSQNRHEQMWLQHVDGTCAAVDLGIAATVDALWTAGVDTAFSCEGAVDALRYVSTRATQRFIAFDVLTRLGERVIGQHGAHCRWVFQLSHQPLSVARAIRTTVGS
jgi:hypothetical protein